jgi:hypothetical protein
MVTIAHADLWLGPGIDILQREDGGRDLYKNIAPIQLQPDPQLRDAARVAIAIMFDLVEVDDNVEDLHAFFWGIIRNHVEHTGLPLDAIQYQFSAQDASTNNISNYFHLDTTIHGILQRQSLRDVGSTGTYGHAYILCSDVTFDTVDAFTVLAAACSSDNTSAMLAVLDAFPQFPVHVDHNNLLRLACSEGAHKVCKLLLKTGRVDPSAKNNECIVTACDFGHIRTVHVLLQHPRTNPAARGNTCIRRACRQGFPDIVQMLLADPRVDARVSNNEPIRNAAINDHANCVEILIRDGGVDPWESECLQVAVRYNSIHVVQFLLTHPGMTLPLLGIARHIAREFRHDRLRHLITEAMQEYIAQQYI